MLDAGFVNFDGQVSSSYIVKYSISYKGVFRKNGKVALPVAGRANGRVYYR